MIAKSSKQFLIHIKLRWVLTDELFYHECAKILGTVYDCEPFPWSFSKRTRWNNRAPGSGRYPGFGTIHCFGDIVHASLYEPIVIIKVFLSKKDALDALTVALLP